MQSFLGFCNNYRKFIRNISEMVKPLLKMKSKKENFEWTEEGLAMFRKLKEMLIFPQLIVNQENKNQFFVECNASDYVIGGVLPQKGDGGTIFPIYYYSKTLSKAEISYSISEKKLLAFKTTVKE